MYTCLVCVWIKELSAEASPTGNVSLVSQENNPSVGSASYPATAGRQATRDFSCTGKEVGPLLIVLTANYIFGSVAIKLATCIPCT